jgi:hypothetical protein
MVRSLCSSERGAAWFLLDWSEIVASSRTTRISRSSGSPYDKDWMVCRSRGDHCEVANISVADEAENAANFSACKGILAACEQNPPTNFLQNHTNNFHDSGEGSQWLSSPIRHPR